MLAPHSAHRMPRWGGGGGLGVRGVGVWGLVFRFRVLGRDTTGRFLLKALFLPATVRIPLRQSQRLGFRVGREKSRQRTMASRTAVSLP